MRASTCARDAGEQVTVPTDIHAEFFRCWRGADDAMDWSRARPPRLRNGIWRNREIRAVCFGAALTCSAAEAMTRRHECRRPAPCR